MTADNVSPMNLVYIRKVGFGVRDFYSAMGKAPDPHRNICHETRPGEEISGKGQFFRCLAGGVETGIELVVMSGNTVDIVRTKELSIRSPFSL